MNVFRFLSQNSSENYTQNDVRIIKFGQFVDVKASVDLNVKITMGEHNFINPNSFENVAEVLGKLVKIIL